MRNYKIEFNSKLTKLTSIEKLPILTNIMIENETHFWDMSLNMINGVKRSIITYDLM